MLSITTSRKPSINTKKLCKYLSHILNIKYIERGKKNIYEFKEYITLFISENHGNPNQLTIIKNDKCLYTSKFSISIFQSHPELLKIFIKNSPVFIGYGFLYEKIIKYYNIYCINNNNKLINQCLKYNIYIYDNNIKIYYNNKLQLKFYCQ